MARIEWVRQRLHNWALYKERESGGGLGFATQSVLLAERSSGYRVRAEKFSFTTRQEKQAAS
jgi:hypothetical protein